MKNKPSVRKKKEKAFHSWDVARFHLNFPNGNRLSTVFGSGTYSDNHGNSADYDHALKRIDRKVFDSDTVEIMFNCGPKLKKVILKKYNGGSQDPIGYLPIYKWLEIVNLLAKPKRHAKKK